MHASSIPTPVQHERLVEWKVLGVVGSDAPMGGFQSTFVTQSARPCRSRRDGT
jgi:hypothetical protein